MGKYEVLCRLSAGGMSEIFLAYQKGLAGFKKIVVLKSILPDISGEEEFVRMFLDEARTTAAFNHPNIAQVFDLDVDGEVLFLAMEFVQGCTLVEMARACRQAREAIPIGLTLQAVRDTALALHYAHTFVDPRGRKQVVIHRDVAEKNIMVTYDGTTKLLDFGIAKAQGRAGHTTVGMVKGTSGYMSPEQIRGDPLDARSDIFSLGVVLHECLTGMRLFHGKNAEEGMLAALREAVAAPSRQNAEVSPDIDAVVLKALERERDRRYNTALEFARAIERAAGGLIWHPEQSGELVQRHFTDRRAQTRDLLDNAQEGSENTGELKLDKIFITAKPAQSMAEPKEEKTTIDSGSSTNVERKGLPPRPPGPRSSFNSLPPVPSAPRMSKPNLPRITDELPQSMSPRATSDDTNTSPVGPPPAPRVSARNLPPIPVSSAPPKTGPIGAVNVRIGPDDDDDDDGEMMKTIPATDLADLMAQKAKAAAPPPTPPVPPRRHTPDSVVTSPEGVHPREDSEVDGGDENKGFNPFDDVSLPDAPDEFDDLDDVGVKTKVGEVPATRRPPVLRTNAESDAESDSERYGEDELENTNGTESANGPRPKRTVLYIVAGLFVTGLVIGGAAFALGLFSPAPKPGSTAPLKGQQRPPPKADPAKPPAEDPAAVARRKADEEAKAKAAAEAKKKDEEAAAEAKKKEEEAAAKDKKPDSPLVAAVTQTTTPEEADDDKKPTPKQAVKRSPPPRKVAVAPKPEPKPEPAPAAKGTGNVSLVIMPNGLKVMHNGVEIGKTPLFNAKLPAGKQVLKLVDASGTSKNLTVVVKADETVSVRSSWDVIPK
jgi:eukaryotic-like serine/threonine-protein kinase